MATGFVVAEKLVELDPEGMVTVEGTVTAALSLDKEMTTPPEGAGPLRLSVMFTGLPPVTLEVYVLTDLNTAVAVAVTSSV